METVQDIWNEITKHEIGRNILICLGLLITYLVLRSLANFLIERWQQKSDGIFNRTRAASLLGALTRGLLGFAFFVAVVSVLFHDAAKTLLGLGLVSVALGFALQATIRDYIAGMMILIEGDIQEGSKLIINGTIQGTVSRIDLRTLRLIVEDGKELTILNGEIKSWQAG